MKKNELAAIAAALLLGAGPAHAAPAKVVSLSPSITESVYLLGEEARLAGVTVYCLYPPQAKTKEKVGTILNPSIEKIASLKPDLVLATGTNNPETISKIRALRINSAVFPLEKDFNDICENFAGLGETLGRKNKALDIIRKAKDRVNLVIRKTESRQKPRVFWEVGSRPLITVAKGSFPDEIISLAGGVNIAHGLATPYIRYSAESVLREDPDIIIIVNDNNSAAGEPEYWKKYKTLKAARTGRIYTVDAHSVCTPVPPVFAAGLEKVAGLIHPEAFSRHR
jgi:iron complex transport system substrate-binding protein